MTNQFDNNSYALRQQRLEASLSESFSQIDHVVTLLTKTVPQMCTATMDLFKLLAEKDLHFKAEQEKYLAKIEEQSKIIDLLK